VNHPNDRVGASAGSTWLATGFCKGIKNILGEQDIWYKIKWNVGRMLISENNVLPLP